LKPISGGCLCGNLRWEATSPPRVSVLCHCDTCRRATGSGVVGWLIFPVESFRFVCGTPASYHTDTGADRTFCPTCGTPLTYHHDGDRPQDMDVTTGSADDGDAWPPVKDIFVEEKLAWVTAVGAASEESPATGDHQ
jgi:hypothetical protein